MGQTDAVDVSAGGGAALGLAAPSDAARATTARVSVELKAVDLSSESQWFFMSPYPLSKRAESWSRCRDCHRGAGVSTTFFQILCKLRFGIIQRFKIEADSHLFFEYFHSTEDFGVWGILSAECKSLFNLLI